MAKPRRGRPPKGAATLTERVELRLTAAQRDKLERLGGADWVRARIDRSTVKA
jgi:hypothetical protein